MKVEEAAVLKVGVTLATSWVGTQRVLLPVSNCLGNCLGCAVTAPSVCLNQVRQDTGQTGRCVPFYDTHNCSTGSSFYVVIG